MGYNPQESLENTPNLYIHPRKQTAGTWKCPQTEKEKHLYTNHYLLGSGEGETSTNKPLFVGFQPLVLGGVSINFTVLWNLTKPWKSWSSMLAMASWQCLAAFHENHRRLLAGKKRPKGIQVHVWPAFFMYTSSHESMGSVQKWVYLQ